MKRAAMIACVAVGVGAGTWYWTRSAPVARATPKAPAASPAPKRAAPSTVLASGVIRLRVGSEVRVGSQVSGIVTTLNVTVGSHIGRDELIAEIDSRELDARLEQARAQVAVAQQEVRRATVVLERATRLDERQLIPRQQLEDAELALDDAKAKLVKAQRDAEVVDTDRSFTQIRAPISGTVASVSTQQGETVAASFTAPTFVTIIADHALQLVAMVDETDIGAVRTGSRATFTVEAYPDRQFLGRVERIAPKATIVSGVVNYEVMITIGSSADVLKPDMTANVSIEPR